MTLFQTQSVRGLCRYALPSLLPDEWLDTAACAGVRALGRLTSVHGLWLWACVTVHRAQACNSSTSAALVWYRPIWVNWLRAPSPCLEDAPLAFITCVNENINRWGRSFHWFGQNPECQTWPHRQTRRHRHQTKRGWTPMSVNNS